MLFVAIVSIKLIAVPLSDITRGGSGATESLRKDSLKHEANISACWIFLISKEVLVNFVCGGNEEAASRRDAGVGKKTPNVSSLFITGTFFPSIFQV